MKKKSPWNNHQYQLVDQDSKDSTDLASSSKNHLARWRASLVCFCRTGGAAEPNSSSGQKIGATQLDVCREGQARICKKDGNGDMVKEIPLKSNLKKPSPRFPVPCLICDEHVVVCEEEGGHFKRKVQWMDVSGGELVNILEYEPSEEETSEGRLKSINERTCVCRIM